MHAAVDLLLTILLLVPLLGTIIIGLPILPERTARPTAIGLSFVMLVLSVVLAARFDYNSIALQFETKLPWITMMLPGNNKSVTVDYHVGIDGMSLSLILLTTIVTMAAVLASQSVDKMRPRFYYSMVMLLTTSILGVFMSQDLVQFFVMFELELVPMYFLIAIWGGPRRDYAAMKFLLYTFTGGILMLAGILFTYFQLSSSGGAPTFNMVELAQQTPTLARGIQSLAFMGFFLAFIIKLPSFPFHTWLPDAHVEAPTPISMILAGLLLKMGSYGLVRICMGFFPDVVATYGSWIIALGCFNVVWAAIACLVQTDMKRVIAYSSVSHMGFILIGVGAVSAAALSGAIFQMIAHGVISAALFFLVGTIYDRTHTRSIPEIGGGLAKQMPYVFYFWMLAAMANLGLPGLAGFVAEVTCFYGAFTGAMATVGPDPELVHTALIIACTGVILTAGYMLWLLKRLFYGPEQPKWVGHLSDMNPTEKIVAYGLSVFILALGIYPMMLTKTYTPYSDHVAKETASRISAPTF